MQTWIDTKITQDDHLGPLEINTPNDRLVSGNNCNSGLIESDSLKKEEETNDQTLAELLNELEILYPNRSNPNSGRNLPKTLKKAVDPA